MTKKTQKKKARTPARFLPWCLVLFAAGLRLVSRAVTIGAYGVFWDLGRWMFSARGLAFTCILAVFGLVSLLMVLDRLATGGAALVSAAEEVVEIDPALRNPVVARIDGKLLRFETVREFALQEEKAAAGELTVEAAFERGLVASAIDQTLVAEAARADGLPMAPEVRAKLRIAERRILYAEFLQKVIEEEATEEKARAVYEAQLKNISFGDEVRIKRVLVKDVQQASEISNALLQEASFDDMVRDYSLDPKFKEVGGDMGYLAFEQMPEGYAERAFETPRGDVTLPFETAQGWVILKVMGRRAIKAPTWEQSKDDIIAFLAERAVAEKLSSLREQAEVVFYEPTQDMLEVEAIELEVEGDAARGQDD